MLLDQIRYLSYMIDGADQKPGDDAYTRFGELEKQLKQLIAAYKVIAKN